MADAGPSSTYNGNMTGNFLLLEKTLRESFESSMRDMEGRLENSRRADSNRHQQEHVVLDRRIAQAALTQAQACSRTMEPILAFYADKQREAIIREARVAPLVKVATWATNHVPAATIIVVAITTVFAAVVGWLHLPF
jgi:hypothetical protein